MLSFHLYLEVRTIACQHEDKRNTLESIARKVEALYPSKVTREELANVWEKIDPAKKEEYQAKGVLLNFHNNSVGILKFRLGLRIDVDSYEDGLLCLDHISRNLGNVFANVQLIGFKLTDVDTI